MTELYLILSGIFVILSYLPLFPSQHWIFRMPDFAKVQLFFLLVIFFILGFLTDGEFYLLMHLALLATILYHAITLVKYTPFYFLKKKKRKAFSSKPITAIAANVYQFNEDTNLFVDLIKRQQPDIFLTMESNLKWEKDLMTLQASYPYHINVALENTYGMHLFSKFKIEEFTVNNFVAEDIPSIECHLKSNDGFRFVFFGVHPPPPSPTEEKNSKERDGELMSVAKRIRQLDKPTVVMGDFNNVAWAKTSVLFQKLGQLIDPRVGRGLLSTFHAKYWFFRFPIDHIFHSTDVFVEKISTLPYFGSDHFPLYAKFFIDTDNPVQEEETQSLEKGEIQEIYQYIKGGKQEISERRIKETEE